MRIILGILMFIVAAAVFAYVGLYLCLYGGIVSAINAFQATPVNVSAIVWGIIRAVFFETFGGLAALIPVLIGASLIGWKIIDLMKKMVAKKDRISQ